MNTCQVRFKYGDFDSCNRCKIVYYCSDVCVGKDRQRHETFCTTKTKSLLQLGQIMVQKFTNDKVSEIIDQYALFVGKNVVCSVIEQDKDLIGLLRPVNSNNPSPIQIIKCDDKINTELRVYPHGFTKESQYVSFSMITPMNERDDTFNDILSPKNIECRYSIVVTSTDSTEVTMVDKIVGNLLGRWNKITV